MVVIAVPPLRKRGEDIGLRARHSLDNFRQCHAKPVHTISPAALQALCAYPSPGNVREWRNAIERPVIMADGEVITEGQTSEVRQIGVIQGNHLFRLHHLLLLGCMRNLLGRGPTPVAGARRRPRMRPRCRTPLRRTRLQATPELIPANGSVPGTEIQSG